MTGEITEEEVAATVYGVHDTLDEIKAWSIDTADWLEHEIERMNERGEAERAASATELMALVNTVYRRLVESEEDSLIPLTELR